MEKLWFQWSAQRNFLWASKGKGKIFVAPGRKPTDAGGWLAEVVKENEKSFSVRLIEKIGEEVEQTIFPPDQGQHYQKVYSSGLHSSANRTSYLIFHPRGWKAERDAAKAAKAKDELSILQMIANAIGGNVRQNSGRQEVWRESAEGWTQVWLSDQGWKLCGKETEYLPVSVESVEDAILRARG